MRNSRQTRQSQTHRFPLAQRSQLQKARLEGAKAFHHGHGRIAAACIARQRLIYTDALPGFLGHFPYRRERHSIRKVRKCVPPVVSGTKFVPARVRAEGLLRGRQISGPQQESSRSKLGGTIRVATKQIEKVGIRRRFGVKRNQQFETRQQSVRIIADCREIAYQVQVRIGAAFQLVLHQRRKGREKPATTLDDIGLFTFRIDLYQFDILPAKAIHAVVECYQRYLFATVQGSRAVNYRSQLRLDVKC